MNILQRKGKRLISSQAPITLPLGKKIYSVVGMFVFPILTFYLFDGYTHNPFTTMKLVPQLLNIAFFEFSLWLLFGLFGRLRIALMVQTTFFMLAGLANYFVLSFRSAPIMPWDIYSIRTAASVAGGFSYQPEATQFFILAGFLALLFLEFFCQLTITRKKWYLRLVLSVASLFLLAGLTSMLHQDTYIRKFKLYDKLFTPAVMNKRCGNSVAFLMELKYISVDKPKGYHPADAATLLASYDTPQTPVTKRPNIIVIMNEAFSDLSVLGDFETNVDYMPFFHAMQKGADNTVTGWLNVSVLGGNTANTEFEFLTGHSLAFLPQGSVAYQQYVKQATPALPAHLKELGYQTVAMHPYHATGWERNRVYPLLGFDDMYFLDDFSHIEELRKYADDATCYKKIEELYEAKGNTPLFVFNVTMQNHSPYTESFDNFSPDVHVADAASDTLDNYLSLIKRSDASLQEFIAYLEEQPEDTIVVFFGDHQPTMSVSKPIRRLNHAATDNLSDVENSLYYKVPFLVWANFDIQKGSQVETSPGILGAQVLQACNLPLSPYENFLIQLAKKHEAVSSQLPLPPTTEDSWLQDYQTLQYYLLFDQSKETK